MSTYPTVSLDTAATELNRLHLEIEQKLRATVEDAIRAGEILEELKTRVGHGNFLSWLHANCEFSERTARNYMAVYAHRDKTASLADLQTAYRQVETLEAQEKTRESVEARARVRRYLDTGEKPDGWRRGTDDRLAEQEKARDERVEAAKAEMDRARVERQESQAPPETGPEVFSATPEMIQSAAQRLQAQERRKRSFKERARLSQAGHTDPIIDALIEYLDEMPDDNRRIEACQNIIKVCRNLAAELQREKSA